MNPTYSHFEVGDRIVFLAETRWSHAKTKRVVNGVTPTGWPTVRFGGHAHFIVRPHEVMEVLPRAQVSA